MAKVGIEATKAQIEKAVEVTDGSTMTGENSVALKGTASGDGSVAVRGTASGERSTAINSDASGDFSVSIGGATTEDNSVAIGLGAKATGVQSVAIGLGAEAKQTNAVQIGEGENDTAQTLQFRNYQLLDANGKIPAGRYDKLTGLDYSADGKIDIEFGNETEHTDIKVKAKRSANNYIDIQGVFEYARDERSPKITGFALLSNGSLRVFYKNASFADYTNAVKFDEYPVANSTKLVNSSGIYNAIQRAIQHAIEIAEGKTATFTLSYATSGNSAFNSQSDYITVDGFTDMEDDDIDYTQVKVGDIVLVTETDVPDRWVQSIDENEGTFTLYKMETAKVDLTNYAQKSYVDNAVATKQDTLTFDSAPTEDSDNPVTSAGIKTYVDTAIGDIDTALQDLISGGGVQ